MGLYTDPVVWDNWARIRRVHPGPDRRRAFVRVAPTVFRVVRPSFPRPPVKYNPVFAPAA